jgi:site-specific DNA recombinase
MSNPNQISNSSIQKLAIVYVRVSSADQLSGTSLEVQERVCREWAERQGVKVVKVFIERGESAKTTDRTEFTKALAFCADRKNKISQFLVYKLDRFARNQDDHVMVRALLKRAGVELRSATEPIDNTSVGRAMEGMISVFAEFDNNVRTERTKSGLYERANQGIWVWPEPVGYHRPMSAENIEPNLTIAPYIKMIFEEYAKGGYTYKSLAKFAGERGFRTKTGKWPSAQLIEKILHNPIYYGGMEIKGVLLRIGTFTPIILKELYDKCQPDYLAKSAHAAPRSANNPMFPLRKLVVCPDCGGKYTGSCPRGGGSKYRPYYHHQYQGCPKAHFIPKAAFEQSFVEFLDSVTPNARYEKLFKAVVTDIWQNNYKQFDEHNAKVRIEVAKLEQERQRIFDLHRAGNYSDDEFLEQKNLVNQHIDEKHRLIQDKRVEEFDMEQALDYCFKFVRETSKTWSRLEADYQLRLRFQKRVLAGNVKFDGQKFGTPELSQVYKINQECGDKKSDVVALRGIEPRFSG